MITFHPKTGVRGVLNPTQYARALNPSAGCPACPTAPDCPECPTCPPPAAVASGSDVPVVRIQGTDQRCVPVCPVGNIGPSECGIPTSCPVCPPASATAPSPKGSSGLGSVPGIVGDAARALEGLAPEGPTPGEAMRQRRQDIDTWLCDSMPWLCSLPGITREPVPDHRTGGTMEGPQPTPQTPPAPPAALPAPPPVDQPERPQTRERRERRQRASARRTCPQPNIIVQCGDSPMSLMKSDARTGRRSGKSRRTSGRRKSRAGAPPKARRRRSSASAAAPAAPAAAASRRAGSRKTRPRASPTPAQQAARARFAARARAGEFRRRSRS